MVLYYPTEQQSATYDPGHQWNMEWVSKVEDNQLDPLSGIMKLSVEATSFMARDAYLCYHKYWTRFTKAENDRLVSQKILRILSRVPVGQLQNFWYEVIFPRSKDCSANE